MDVYVNIALVELRGAVKSKTLPEAERTQDIESRTWMGWDGIDCGDWCRHRSESESGRLHWSLPRSDKSSSSSRHCWLQNNIYFPFASLRGNIPELGPPKKCYLVKKILTLRKFLAWFRGGVKKTGKKLFLKDLSTCTEGPQRWSFITQKW